MGDDGPELLVGHHIDPRHGCGVFPFDLDDIFPAVLGEAAPAVEEKQVVLPEILRCGDGPFEASRCDEFGDGGFTADMAPDLVGQRAAAIQKDHPGRGLHQYLVFLRHLVLMTQKHPARFIIQGSFGTRGNETDNPIVENLPVARPFFVPNDKVHRQSFQSPVSMRLYQFGRKVDCGRIADPQQDNGQVAGNTVGP